MSVQDFHPNNFIELRSICKYYIDSCNALYQLKTEKEEELNSIYKMIKTELIDSMIFHPHDIIMDILNFIPYNNRFIKSYLFLIKQIYDDYQVRDIPNACTVPKFLFYKEYGIKLNKSDNFENPKFENLDIHEEDTIYRAIMYNDLKRFISSTEGEGFDKDQKLKSDLYPPYYTKFSLLELCCYHGAVDCFKFLRTKFNPEITQTCLQFSFLGGNPEIMSECLKYQTPNEACMKCAIISHNIDFVTFLKNEYNMGIDIEYCGIFNNLESFLVHFDQTNNINMCFFQSVMLNISSLCKYFLSHGANINEKYRVSKGVFSTNLNTANRNKQVTYI
ncbi:hypothetical protein TVAG_528020 [Trichomonas vaginalis G3]|uniref:DUF3447 domain-containing protein n=1 Tax=Trichomonas vaginalis (strain ATCC PRA-98 / G3) TaxID=412133 RepID=A2GMP5_TRIV3|nr:hypothetical protein TVAG_528020 [Trichomonas vaginalis G3]|eukprot:XP_001294502.1 hypothetical protein [Trichomonas vaginalis G3]